MLSNLQYENSNAESKRKLLVETRRQILPILQNPGKRDTNAHP